MFIKLTNSDSTSFIINFDKIIFFQPKEGVENIATELVISRDIGILVKETIDEIELKIKMGYS